MIQLKSHGYLSAMAETTAHFQRVFHCERVWRTFEDGKANDGASRCAHRRFQKLEVHSLADRLCIRPKTADAYRKGCNSRAAPQGSALEMLEPYDGKLSRTVLRGEGAARP